MKRLLSIFCVLFMLLLVAGCSQDGKRPESQTESSESSDLTETTNSEEEGTTTQGGEGTTTGTGGTSKSPSGTGTTVTKNQGQTGETKTAGGWKASDTKYTADQMDTPYALRKNISGTIYAYTPFNDEIFNKAVEMFKKAYPKAKIEPISTNNVSRHEKLQMLVRSGSSPDYVYSTYQDYPLRAIRGMTMPIDEYIQFHPSHSAVLMNNYASYKGKKYAVIHETPPQMIYYNTSIFSKKGEKTPKQYFDEGNWTWDTLRTVAKKMTDLQSGIYGFATDTENIFPLSVGQDVIKFVNGKPKLNLVNNKTYMDAHQVFIDMIVKDKSTYPTKYEANTQFLNGKVAMVFPNGDFKTICKKNNMTTYDVVPFPRKDKNSPYYTTSGGFNGGFSIAKGAKNIEGGMAFGEMMFNAGLELTGNITNYRAEYELAQRIGMIKVASWAVGYDISGLYLSDLCNWARTGTKDLNTLINENAPLMEAKINELISGS